MRRQPRGHRAFARESNPPCKTRVAQEGAAIMRLVYVHNIAMPGPEANTIQVAKMCSAFAGLGHEVTLMALPDTKDSRYAERLLSHYDIAHRFRVVPLPPFAERPSIAALV